MRRVRCRGKTFHGEDLATMTKDQMEEQREKQRVGPIEGQRAGDADGVTRVLLARHGEVSDRWRRTVYGRMDVELSPVGLEQSRRLGEAVSGIRFDAVVSSGLQRAEAAAAEVRRACSRAHEGLELPRRDDERFLELDRGDWAGRTVDELEVEDPEGFQRWIECRGAVHAPGGESPGEVAARVIPGIDDWAGQHTGGTILIVAHLWVVRSAVAWALGVPMERSGQLSLPPGGICDFLWRVSNGGAGAPHRPMLMAFGAGAVPTELDRAAAQLGE